MNKEIKEIFSENPVNDQWQILLRFAYSNNIKKYLVANGVESFPDNLLEIISNSFQQAYEYYKAAQTVSLNISPLLIYYGTTNLLLATASIVSGEKLSIENHGMQLIIPKNFTRIADVEIKIRDPRNGAFNNFNKIFSNSEYLPSGENWTLLESLGAILELKDDFENVYENDYPYTIPLQVIKKKDEKFWRLNETQIRRFPNQNMIFELIPEFKNNYLSPISTQKGSNLIIRKKLNGNDLSEISISGESYFAISNTKNNKHIPLPLVSRIFLGLYALGFLSRYHPDIWAPFIRTDSTGEKQLIEKFIHLAKRYIPNLCLDYLYNKKYVFLDQIKNIKDISEKTQKEELQDFIREEIALLMKDIRKEKR